MARSPANTSVTSTTARLARWSVCNAVGMLFGVTAAGLWHTTFLLGVVTLGSFALLVVSFRGQWTGRGRFGVANAITATRLGLVVLSAFAQPMIAPATFCAVAVGITLLDGIDGWVARRQGLASEFGAHFDMETDAAFILLFTSALWLRHLLPVWIIAAGMLRPAFVLWQTACTWVGSVSESAPGSNERRTLFGRVAFVVLALGSALAWVLPRYLGVWTAGLGLVLVSVSFARSFFWSCTHAMNSRAAATHGRGESRRAIAAARRASSSDGLRDSRRNESTSCSTESSSSPPA